MGDSEQPPQTAGASPEQPARRALDDRGEATLVEPERTALDQVQARRELAFAERDLAGRELPPADGRVWKRLQHFQANVLRQ